VEASLRINPGGAVRIYFLDEAGDPILDGTCIITITDMEDNIEILDRNMTYRGTGRYYYTPRLNLGDYQVETECNKTINNSLLYYGANFFNITITTPYIPVRPIEPADRIEDPHFNAYEDDSEMQGIINAYLADSTAYQIWLVMYEKVFLQGMGFFTTLLDLIIFFAKSFITIIGILITSFVMIIFAGFFLYQSVHIRLQAIPVIIWWRFYTTSITIMISITRFFFDVLKFSITTILKIVDIIVPF
jgi:hypothetical protein